MNLVLRLITDKGDGIPMHYELAENDGIQPLYWGKVWPAEAREMGQTAIARALQYWLEESQHIYLNLATEEEVLTELRDRGWHIEITDWTNGMRGYAFMRPVHAAITNKEVGCYF